MTEKLLEAMKDTRVIPYLAKLGPFSRILAPQEVVERVLAINPDCEAVRDDLEAAEPAWKRLIVWDAAPGSITEAQRKYGKGRVIGIFRDVWPSIVTRADPFQLRSEPPHLAQHNFAILCNPRSGSTFLAQLLGAAGLGNPVEHVRDLFVELYDRGWSAGLMMERFMTRSIVNDIFGTKIVSNFLYKGGYNSALPLSLEGYLKQHKFQIIYLRRDEVEQAVSAYFAKITAIWHVKKLETLTHHREVPYDAQMIRALHTSFVHLTAILEELVSRFHSTIHIDYNALDSQPFDTLRAIHRDLGSPAGFNDEIDLAPLTQKISTSVPLMQEFCERFRADLRSAA